MSWQCRTVNSESMFMGEDLDDTGDEEEDVDDEEDDDFVVDDSVEETVSYTHLTLPTTPYV